MPVLSEDDGKTFVSKKINRYFYGLMEKLPIINRKQIAKCQL